MIAGLLPRLLDGIRHLVRLFAGLALFALLVVVVAQVVLRYGFRITPLWIEELGRYLLVWSVLAGSAAAVHTGEHIRVDLVERLLGPGAGWLLGRFFDLVSIAVFAVILWFSFDAVAFAIGRSQGMRIPMAWPYMALPIFFGASLLFAIDVLIRGPRRP